MNHNIPEKANRVLNVIILGLLLILARVWYLAVIQHDDHLEKARRPKRRTLVEKVERATIRDRFNIPMALNKIQYNAAICYADIRGIPAGKWEINSEGKKVRVPVRSNYIQKLSSFLASELQLDAQKIEDTIHGKAALFPHTPFIIKEDLSEEDYYRLKGMEKDWIGIRAEKGSKRYYPHGKVGADVIGYMGAISGKEYYSIAAELGLLQTYLSERESGEAAALPKGFNNPLEVRERLKNIQEKAYTINDLVGKMGVEGAFDADLRGYAGKKICEVDTKGNFLRELPGGRKKVSGHRLMLSISSELQEFAEELLIADETVRESRLPDAAPDLSTPWIKGGAIVALDPKTGEVIALASYPRMDPNDFIPSSIPEVRANKQASVAKWLENETFIAEIWDGRRPLERERLSHDTLYNESINLTLERYLETILAKNSQISVAMQKISSLKTIFMLQEALQALLQMSQQEKMSTLIDALYSDSSHLPSKISLELQEKKNVQMALIQQGERFSELKHRIDSILSSIKHNNDKLLLIDLCRLIVDRERFSPSLIQQTESLSLSGYRLLNQSYSTLQAYAQTQARAQFHQGEFRKWREENFKQFLKEKRKLEKEKKWYARPYTDYLEQIEKQMFANFWQEKKLSLVHALILGEKGALPSEIAKAAEILQKAISPLHLETQIEFLQTMRVFEELDRPLYGKYRALRNTKGVQLEKHLASAFYPISGYGYGRSQAFRQTTPAGSVFKLPVGYQGLLERYQALQEMQRPLFDLNPLTLTDNLQWHPKLGSPEQVLGYQLDGQPIKRLYKGGIMPRSSHPNIGKIDIIAAIERSSNIYFSVLCSDHIKDPTNLIEASKLFGFGEKTGIELPGEIAGNLPDDLSHNRTGLYSFAIGQHSLIVTPLQTALMLSAIANRGDLFKPKIVQVIAGRQPLREYRDPFLQTSYPFQEELAAVGIHFPLFSSMQSESTDPYIWYQATETKRKLFMPDSIRDPIVEGMHQVITSPKGTARPNIIRALGRHPEWMRHYQELKNQLIGKTGTAEVFYKQSIDAETEGKIHNHIWFGGVVFSPEDNQKWEDPELVVVVYLRYSQAGGKEAAPLGVEVAKKWREIRQRHEHSR
jgi:cell division protein FtsI/penicillin-binding protein 2